MAKRTAVIDIGSNSVRMIIMEKTSRFAFHLLHEVKSRVRISENAYQNGGELQEEPIQRAISALRDFMQIAHSYDARKILCVATSAVRDANNKKSFLSRVRKELGLNIKVISGEREAYLGGIACANLLPLKDAMTLDIGGGSTEYACTQDAKVLSSDSLDLGTVRLKELFFDKNDIKGAKAYIDSVLEGLKAGNQEDIIGVGGTFRALAQIIMKKKAHPLDKLHGFTFNAEDMVALGEKIINAKDTAALKALGVKKERYDVIKPGTLILLRIIKKVGAKRLISSGVGLREGLYLSDLLRHNKDVFPENFNPSLTYLLDQHSHNAAQRNLRVKLTKRLFMLLHQELALDPTLEKSLLIAAKLAKVGAAHNFYHYQQHSHYLALSALEYGYTHQEIALISMLLLYQLGKSPKKSYIAEYQVLLPSIDTIKKLSYLLALSDALLTDHPSKIDFELRVENSTLVVVPNKRLAYLAKESVLALGDDTIKVAFAL
ncbi:Ppx/GppA phosphatase family protein [Sulfurimonas sp. HSL3-7]|uniref:Ppx/GppA phosphatase family protein n=1 Tax=Sulfonitrofixus jiaomeiensis TaxID=3131938 RepID=UPI0031F7780F